jgi:hypothetical protein
MKRREEDTVFVGVSTEQSIDEFGSNKRLWSLERAGGRVRKMR